MIYIYEDRLLERGEANGLSLMVKRDRKRREDEEEDPPMGLDLSAGMQWWPSGGPVVARACAVDFNSSVLTA